jgi:triosephosphate isomerase
MYQYVMKKLIAGNWKMNGSVDAGKALMGHIFQNLKSTPEVFENNDFLVCPSFVFLPQIRALIDESGYPIQLGAQNSAAFKNGAFTGEISSSMLADIGCGYVILGHSERRHILGETDNLIQQKAALAIEAGLKVILCVGETEAERSVGQQNQVVGEQLRLSIPSGASAENIIIAYEPVWAIGTGKVATTDDIHAMHEFIWGLAQDFLANSEDMRILYGGSVKPDNAAAIFAVPHVDGALIGGASLDADQFLAIARANIA